MSVKEEKGDLLSIGMDSKPDLASHVLFTSFVVSSTADYASLIQFYKKLGFRIVKTFSKDSYISNSSSVPGISSDSRKECWLESFPCTRTNDKGNIIPFQETIEYSHPGLATSESCLNRGVVLKIRLVSHDVHKNIELPGRIVLLTYSLDSIKKIIKNENLKLISPSLIEKDLIEFFIEDPLGNLIGFTNKDIPNLNKKIDSKDDFFVSDKIINSIKEKELKSDTNGKSNKKRIAVLTSGGDSQGMCAVVRSVVRAGIYLNCEVFGCYEGYSGLVKGGDLLKKLEWGDVRGWLSLGGTLIGTARCKEFREREGRLLAAKNMILRGIDALVVCGGDGSLTGADLFRSEWPDLVKELVNSGIFTNEQVEPYRNLTIVGLVGSIDNDMAMTDNTIGAYSSLERICEMVDYIDSTAASHSRAFVVEVMGRNCGWLALMAGICTGADYSFLPERPADSKTWKDQLKEICLRHRSKGRRKTTVIVAEGAIDNELNKITSEDVLNCLVEIGLDTRITQLGHVQRGGTAVAFDRFLATIQGVEAIKAVLENTPSTPSPMIGILNNRIVRKPLVEAVKLTKDVAKAISEKRFDDAMSLRDSTFKELYSNFISISQGDDEKNLLPIEKRLNIAIIHVGAPTAALNAATRAAVLYLLSKGHKAFGIQNGFTGLIRHGTIKEFNWIDVEEWHNLGGSQIGTNRSLPSLDFGAVSYHLQENKIQGLIVIGGFEGFQAVKELKDARIQYPIFNMPIVCLPSTISNNIPGTEYSIGTDTCLNVLVNYCDAVKQSASSSRRRVFVIEVQGGNCGYIASYCGLVTGALAVYTPETKISLKSVREDLDLLEKSYINDHGDQRSGKIFIRNEKASKVYTTELVANIIKEQAHGKFESRTAIPGHVQQGKIPSSMDRIAATRFAIKACQFIEEDNEIIDENINKFNNKYGIIQNINEDVNEFEGSESKDYFNAQKDLKYVYKHGKKINISKQSNAVLCSIKGTSVHFKDIEKIWNEQTDIAGRKGTDIHWEIIPIVNDILSGRLMIRENKV
ncbi:6-phosphofructokinase, alpha subunit [Pichia californica]|nr:6-phosphofructokinase, alpha subunit [[Candida] californica]